MAALWVDCPATTANLGPGFDALGLALTRSNRFRIEPAATFELTASGAEAELVPREAARNAVVKAYQAARAALGLAPAAGLRVHAEVWAPPGRGLGSSATATAAGILAAEALAERPGASLGLAARLALASELEGHPDNVVPCLLGGLCVAARGPAGELAVERFDLPDPPACVVAVPSGITLATDAMRAALPAQVSHADAVLSVGRVALLVAALLSGRPEALRAALCDRLHEPYRGPHLPAFAALQAAGRAAGAYGVVISGSGPSLLALAPPAQAEEVAAALQAAWAEVGIAAQASVLAPEPRGARVEPTR